MHIGCRYGSCHNAVKLVQARALPQLVSIHSSRSFTTTSRGLQFHNLASTGDENKLGAYTPNANPNIRAREIAIIGGGISGLATAFNLVKDIPFAKITIFEEKERLGGWAESEKVEVDDGKVLFEWGPRTLRPDMDGNGMATLQLVRDQNMISRKVLIKWNRSIG